jgi:hypothetical protein
MYALCAILESQTNPLYILQCDAYLCINRRVKSRMWMHGTSPIGSNASVVAGVTSIDDVPDRLPGGRRRSHQY